jgi:hypothetical protein
MERKMDLLNRKYTAQSVALATGTTAKQITDWCNQGQIIGQKGTLGKGHRREFSFFNVMEVAGAVSLMEIGIRSPADAFKAASHFAHTAPGGSGWVVDGEIIEGDSKPKRWPSLPYHPRDGETFLVVSGDLSKVVLSQRGELNTFSFFSRPRPAGFILLNMSEVFRAVTQRMALDYREALDEAYEV